ncbi:archaeosortase A [Methanococcoides orientis]|uniref:archaeosortase A n=1 Tax=Methanococcoides orientis TaxID=2822137 RepID=UPI001E329A19|nr:archaeosortase A [Methanococcoides orientis]UGV40747.1 archaeosortase A [Methanococcoides orientis]
MIENVLWIAVALMVLSSIIPATRGIKFLTGGVGWIFFSLHWAYQPLHYIEISDYFNVVLTLAIAAFCLFMAHNMIREYREPSESGLSQDTNIILMVTSATAIGSLFYFPFANIPSLNQWIISNVTNATAGLLGLLGYNVESTWHKITYNGYTVQIILACTAIESIALFTGLIVSINVSFKRLMSAFMISVPVIFALNIVRNVFVIAAYGDQWFGPESFEIAHHVIAKFGSAIALFVIAYAVMRILPELLDMIDGLWQMTTRQIRDILRKS